MRFQGGCSRLRLKYLGAPKKNPGSLAEARTPSILTGPVHPFGSLAALSVPPSGRLRAHSFATPPRDGCAFIEDSFRVAIEKVVIRDKATIDQL
jgi:hypothetical protein